MPGFSSTSSKDVVFAKNVDFSGSTNPSSTITTNGQLLIGRTALNAGGTHIDVNTLTAGTGISITNGPGTITIASTASATDLHVAKWIVNATPNAGGNQTTIAAALTAASSGDTIFVMPGIYTENLTLKAGVNLVAFPVDGDTPNVTIVGKLTFTTAGTVGISGIRLQTNSDFFLAITGSAASIVNLNNCYLNCTNNTGISFTSSSGSAQLNIYMCRGDLGTTGIGLYSSSSAGALVIQNCRITNSGGSTTNSSSSSGFIFLRYTTFNFPISTSGTSAITLQYVFIDTHLTNATCLTHNGSGSGTSYSCAYSSGTASAVSIGVSGSLFMSSDAVTSSNTNAITGAGAILYSGINFPVNGTSTTINTTTQTGSGTLQGSKNTAPSAGFLGEQIRSYVPVGSAVTLTTGTGANITSISLTAGIWDVSALGEFNGTVTGTSFQISISSTSATPTANSGDDLAQTPTAPTAGSNNALVIPSFRVTLNATTTYYLVAIAAFTVGTCKAFGRISATRVG